jgi:hypothetical protein
MVPSFIKVSHRVFSAPFSIHCLYIRNTMTRRHSIPITPSLNRDYMRLFTLLSQRLSRCVLEDKSQFPVEISPPMLENVHSPDEWPSHCSLRTLILLPSFSCRRFFLSDKDYWISYNREIVIFLRCNCSFLFLESKKEKRDKQNAEGFSLFTTVLLRSSFL